MTYLEEFVCAVENEVVNDNCIYQIYSVNPSDFSYLPRPAKWLARHKDHKLFIYSLGLIVRYFWLLGGGALFFSFKCIQSLMSFTAKPHLSGEVLRKTEFGLGFSDRAYDIINVNSLGRELQAWIVLPWLGITKSANSKSDLYSIESLLELKDFYKAFILSIRSIYFLRNAKLTSSHVLQGYTAFHWFLTRIALSKLNHGSFYTSEHFDRWALLIDFVVSDLKEKGHQASLSVVQHGMLKSLTNTSHVEDLQSYSVRHRLKSVSSIYVYDNESARVFNDSILEKGAKSEVYFFKPQISLQKIEKTAGQVTLLFVGHSICEEMQVYLFQQLQKTTTIKAYYKPHPTCVPHQSVRNENWILIDTPAFYPAVDLLVSYPSTLVTEYASHGISAVIHPINLSSETASDILKQIREYIAKISL